MSEMLSKLSKEYKIGLLSDTDPIHWQFVLKNYVFLQSIENPTLSFEAGYMKPHPELYHIAADNVKYPLKECLFIDDRKANVEGAQKLGMKAVQFEDTEQFKNYLRQIDML